MEAGHELSAAQGHGMEEQAYARTILTERPGLLRRRRQMKWVREFEEKFGASEWLRSLVA